MFPFLFFINFLSLVSSIPKESIHIIEDLPIGSSIYTFITDGCQTENSTGTYRFVDSQKNSNDFFLIDPYKGRVVTKKLIDRDDFCLRRMCACSKCEITLEVLCVHLGQIYFNDLSVIIDDRNDHAPQFPKSSLTIDVLENVPVGYLIPIDVAIDPDDGINSIQGYKLLEENSTSKQSNNRISQAFQIDYSKKNDLLALRLMKNLDRELCDSLQYVVHAYDGGQPQPLFGKLTIRINILDVNDMSPVFDRADIHVLLSESTSIGSLVARVHAFDGDTGLNGVVHYSIVSLDPPSNGTFHLSKESGEIRLGKKLDYEKERSFRMKVKAQDNGPQQGSIPAFATINIDIKDENDNVPLLTPTFNDDSRSGVEHLVNSSIIRVRENTPNGTFLVSKLVGFPCSSRDFFFCDELNLFMSDSISRMVRDEKDFHLSFYLRPCLEVNLSLSMTIPQRATQIYDYMCVFACFISTLRRILVLARSFFSPLLLFKKIISTKT